MTDANHGPELSSITTALGELAARLTAIAEACAGTEADGLAHELYAVERALGEAMRRLGSLDAASAPGRRRD